MSKLTEEIREALKPHRVESFAAFCVPMPTLQQMEQLMAEVEQMTLLNATIQRQADSLLEKLHAAESTNDFDAKRLRRLATLVGASTPESDETLLGCAGTVIGSICRQVEGLFKRSVDGWIATKDQLPQEGQEVTIRMTHGQIRQAVKDKGYAGGWKQPNCAGWEIVTWHGDTITHWRPEIFERPSKDGY